MHGLPSDWPRGLCAVPALPTPKHLHPVSTENGAEEAGREVFHRTLWGTGGEAPHRQTRAAGQEQGHDHGSWAAGTSPASLPGPLLFLGSAAPTFPLGAATSEGSAFTSAPQGDKMWAENNSWRPFMEAETSWRKSSDNADVGFSDFLHFLIHLFYLLCQNQKKKVSSEMKTKLKSPTTSVVFTRSFQTLLITAPISSKPSVHRALSHS